MLKEIKGEPLNTEEKEMLINGIFGLFSNEKNQFISKEKYDKLREFIIDYGNWNGDELIENKVRELEQGEEWKD